jgi:hypothetical protein
MNYKSYTKILTILYFAVSITAMVLFFFYSAPKSDEYIGLNSLAMWGTLLSAFMALLLSISTILWSKKQRKKKEV